MQKPLADRVPEHHTIIPAGGFCIYHVPRDAPTSSGMRNAVQERPLINPSSRTSKKPVDLTQYDEPRLKKIAEWALSPDFTIKPEVTGTYLVDGQSRLRIDYLLYPLPHLIEQGFIAEWIGLEVKSTQSTSVSGYDFAWQTITYANSEFEGKRPPFVLMFPSIKVFFGEDSPTGRSLQALLQYANVGQLELGRYQDDSARDWKMTFGPVPYFSKRYGAGAQPNAALKRRVGNSS